MQLNRLNVAGGGTTMKKDPWWRNPTVSHFNPDSQDVYHQCLFNCSKETGWEHFRSSSTTCEWRTWRAADNRLAVYKLRPTEDRPVQLVDIILKSQLADLRFPQVPVIMLLASIIFATILLSFNIYSKMVLWWGFLYPPKHIFRF